MSLAVLRSPVSMTLRALRMRSSLQPSCARKWIGLPFGAMSFVYLTKTSRKTAGTSAGSSTMPLGDTDVSMCGSVKGVWPSTVSIDVRSAAASSGLSRKVIDLVSGAVSMLRAGPMRMRAGGRITLANDQNALVGRVQVLDTERGYHVIPLDVEGDGEARAFGQVGVHHVLQREDVVFLDHQVVAI